jgi:hypothetical protein
MKKIPLCFVSLLLCLFLARTTSAAITSVSFSSSDVNNTGTSSTGGNLTEPFLTYASLNFIDVTIVVDAAGTYTINEAPLFGGVSNHTGQTWLGFDLSLQIGAVGVFNNDWATSNNTFATIVQTPTEILFSGGNVPNNTTFGAFGTFNAVSAGTFVIRETPLTVPEPSSVALFALGIMGGVLFRRYAAS